MRGRLLLDLDLRLQRRLSVLPSVTTYLENLPRGVASYPHSQVKGAIVSAALAGAGLNGPLTDDQVPACVAELTRQPPSVNIWVPEVHYGAMIGAIYDLRFRDRGGLDAFQAWVLEGNRALLRSPLYRVLFLVVSPERVFIGADQRWARFHRGSLLSVLKRASRTVTLRLTYPEHLFAEHAVRGFAMAFRAAGEAAGAKHQQIRHEIESPGATRYELEWL